LSNVVSCIAVSLYRSTPRHTVRQRALSPLSAVRGATPGVCGARAGFALSHPCVARDPGAQGGSVLAQNGRVVLLQAILTLTDLRKRSELIHPLGLDPKSRWWFRSLSGSSPLGAYITELDRRRHEAFDVRPQVRKHKGLAITVGASLIALTAGLAVYWANDPVKSPTMMRLRRDELPEEKDSNRSRVTRAAVGVLGAVKGGAQRAVSGRGSFRRRPRLRWLLLRGAFVHDLWGASRRCPTT